MAKEFKPTTVVGGLAKATAALGEAWALTDEMGKARIDELIGQVNAYRDELLAKRKVYDGE